MANNRKLSKVDDMTAGKKTDYAANREKIRARNRAYYAANREKIRARNKAYHAARSAGEAKTYALAKLRELNLVVTGINESPGQAANREAIKNSGRQAMEVADALIILHEANLLNEDEDSMKRRQALVAAVKDEANEIIHLIKAKNPNSAFSITQFAQELVKEETCKLREAAIELRRISQSEQGNLFYKMKIPTVLVTVMEDYLVAGINKRGADDIKEEEPQESGVKSLKFG